MVPYCNFSVHTAANMYKREIPHPYLGELIFMMCPLDPEGGLFRAVTADNFNGQISRYPDITDTCKDFGGPSV